MNKTIEDAITGFERLVSLSMFRLSKTFRLSLRSRLKIYFFFNRAAKKDVITKSKKQTAIDNSETWRQYYIRVYGEIPDFVKYSSNDFYRDLDAIKPQVDIVETIKNEEEKYIKLFERNKEMIVKKYSDVGRLNGETLAKLHHTYGCDPTMIEDVLDIFLPEQLHQDYLREYEKHKLTGMAK